MGAPALAVVPDSLEQAGRILTERGFTLIDQGTLRDERYD